MTKHCILITTLFCVSTAFSQTNADSLEARLPETSGRERLQILADLASTHQRDTPEKTLRYGREALTLLARNSDSEIECAIQNAMGWAFIYTNNSESAMVYAERAEQLAQSHDFTREHINAGYLKGRILRKRGEFEQALANLHPAKKMAEEAGADTLLASILNEIGSIHRRQSNYQQALEHHQRALELNQKLDDKSGMASTFGYIGIIHDIVGDYDKALNAHQQALDLRKQLRDRRGVAGSLHNIGTLHQKIRDYQGARKFYNQALEVWKELGLKNELATTLNGIGAIEDILGNYKEALDYYLRALTLWEETEDRYRISVARHNIGSVLEMLNKYDSALDYHLQAFNTRKQLGDRYGMASSLGSLAIVYQKLGDREQAIASAKQGVEIAGETGSWVLMEDMYETLSALYEEYDMYAEALSAYKHFKAAHDSVFNRESQSRIAELQEQYRTQEQQQQIVLLEREYQIQRLWLGGLAGGILLLAALAFLAISRYRIKNRAHRQLEKAHEHLKATQQQLIQAEKLATVGKLAAGIAHEINNPNGVINSSNSTSMSCIRKLTETLEHDRNGETSDKMLRILEDNTRLIATGTTRINEIVQSLKKFAGSDTEEAQETDLHENIESVLVLLSHEFGDRITVKKEYGDLPQISCFPNQLNQVFLSLLTNATQAIESTGTITITTSQVNDHIQIDITDTGRGIPPAKLRSLFDFGFTSADKRVKMGSGLMMANNIIRRHNGEIKVTSEPGKGSTFSLILPVAQPELE